VRQLETFAPLIVVALFGFSLLLLVLAVLRFRQSRRGAYWRFRRMAGRRGLQLLVLSVVLAGVALIGFMGMGILSLLRPAPPATPTLTEIAANPTPTRIPPTDIPTVPAIEGELTATPTALLLALATFTSMPTPLEPTSAAAAVGIPTAAPTGITPTERPTRRPTETESPTPSRTSLPTETSTPTSSPTSAPTATETPTNSPTPSPTATETPLPTPTFLPLSVLVAALPPLTVTPPAEATLTITALATAVTLNGEPADAGESFPAGFTRLYFWVDYAGLQSGVLVRRVLRRDGQIVAESSALWGLGSTGKTYFFIGLPAGFAAGRYEVLLYLGDVGVPTARAVFTIS